MSSDLSIKSPVSLNKQFLASKTHLSAVFLENWQVKSIGDYHFYIHPNQIVTQLENDHKSVLLIGNIYDYRNPEFTNSNILESLLKNEIDILSEIAHYSGEFIFAFKENGSLSVLNDAGGLMELYYSTDFKVFGSQIKLISKVYDLKLDTDPLAVQFYNSKEFKNRKFYVTNRTEYANILHLKPNHLLKLSEKVCERFYPDNKLEQLGAKEIARRMSEMLTGYLASVGNRKTIAVPITAGWDSRILLGAAIKANVENIRFYVIHHSWMNDNHQDLLTAKKIAKKLNLKLDVITYKNEISVEANQVFSESLDHNREQSNARIYNTYYREFGAKGITIINGNVSEVARAFYPNVFNLTGKDLARLYGYPNDKYVIREYNDWILQNASIFDSNNLNTMDMIYWDERIGNWMAKMKSAYMLFSDHFSPYNSRILLHTSLSSKRQDRDTYYNSIYREILSILSPELLKLPINPGAKTGIIKFMKKTRFYPIYQNIGIKLGLLTFN